MTDLPHNRPTVIPVPRSPEADIATNVQPAPDTNLRADNQQTLSEPGVGVMPSSPTAVIGVGSRLGPYELVRKLGEGGMGAVYEARHSKLEKTYAVKVLPSKFSANPLLLSRFLREMKAVGKLDHPHIVRAVNADEWNGTHYLVMEYIEGTDLSALIKARGKFSVRNACMAMRHAALGLQHAHEHGLVHRDIKPANLFVTKSGQVKLLDLGLARLGDDLPADEVTSAGDMMGTPDYMAPEQWDDAHAVDARSDLYSLGCTLFYTLVGKSPFSLEGRQPMMKLMKAHAEGPIPDLLAIRPDVPAELNAIYLRLLAKRPEDRFATAAEVAAALEPFSRKEAKVTELPSSPSSSTTNNAVDLPAELPPQIPDANPSEVTEVPDDRLEGSFAEESKTEYSMSSSQRRKKTTSVKKSKRSDRKPWIIAGVVGLLVVLAVGVIIKMSGPGGSSSGNNVGTDSSVANNAETQTPTTGPERVASAERDTGDQPPDLNAKPVAQPDQAPSQVDPSSPATEPVAAVAPAQEKPTTPAPVASETNPVKPMAIPGTTKELLKPVRVVAPRVTIPAAPLGTKGNKPLSNRAVVNRPPPIGTLRGWSLEVAGHTGSIMALRFSPDGRFIASAGHDDDTVRIWRIEQVGGSPVLALERVLLGEEGKIADLAWSPDGFTLATITTLGHAVTLFDALTGRMLKRIAVPDSTGAAIKWSPDGKLLIAGCHPQPAFIDPMSGSVRFVKRSAPIFCSDVSWSPDGTQFVSADESGTLMFWKPQASEATAELKLNSGALHAVAWSPDSRWIAAAGREGTIRVWNAETKKLHRELRGESGEVFELAWEPASANTGATKHPAWPRLAVASHVPSPLSVWDIETGERLMQTRLPSEALTVTWAPDCSALAVGQRNHFNVVDAATGGVVGESSDRGCPNLDGIATDLARTGKQLRVHQFDSLTVWDAESGSLLKRVNDAPSGQSLASPDDQWLASFNASSPQGELHLIDTETYQQRRPLLGHSETVVAVNWSADSKQLASASRDRTVRIWNAESAEQVKIIQHTQPVRCVTWSPDGKLLATVADDDIVRTWQVATGAMQTEFRRLPIAVMPFPWTLAWSPDGKTLAIALGDGSARVLDPKSGKLSDPIFVFNTSAGSVAWSGDSKQLLAGTYGQAGYRAVGQREGTSLLGYGFPLQWHPDRKRFLSGVGGYCPVHGFDSSRNVRLGTLYPRLAGTHHVCISPDGHYRGSEGIEQHIVYVALTKDGHQETYSPTDFANKFGWKNDPTKARLLAPTPTTK